ncbi:MAG: hypothetical protein LBP75_09460 [Planctomycetota bacterium]|jgi:hypothetical protein|nr:hypothetical protein [Planctomycetota bacterium]
MTTNEQESQKWRDFVEKIDRGLDLAYERMLADKKLHQREVAVMRGDKIVRFIPA